MNWPATRSLPLRLLHPRVIALTALVIGGNAWRTAHTAANTSDDNVTEHSELSRSVAELRDAVHELERETEMMKLSFVQLRTDGSRMTAPPTFAQESSDLDALRRQLRGIEVENESLALKVNELERRLAR